MVWLCPDDVAIALARYCAFILEEKVDEILLILAYFLRLGVILLLRQPILKIVLSDQVLVLARSDLSSEVVLVEAKLTA